MNLRSSLSEFLIIYYLCQVINVKLINNYSSNCMRIYIQFNISTSTTIYSHKYTICFPRLYARPSLDNFFLILFISYYQYLDSFIISHSIFLYYILSHNCEYKYTVIILQYIFIYLNVIPIFRNETSK